jgi:hypothetical protein
VTSVRSRGWPTSPGADCAHVDGGPVEAHHQDLDVSDHLPRNASTGISARGDNRLSRHIHLVPIPPRPSLQWGLSSSRVASSRQRNRAAASSRSPGGKDSSCSSLESPSLAAQIVRDRRCREAVRESAKNRGVWFPLEANTELIDAGHDPLLIGELYPECTPMLSLGLPDPPVFSALHHAASTA